jgi:hypothetical protein
MKLTRRCSKSVEQGEQRGGGVSGKKENGEKGS